MSESFTVCAMVKTFGLGILTVGAASAGADAAAAIPKKAPSINVL